MEAKRLFEIFDLLKINPPGGGKQITLCRRLGKELGVTRMDIDNEKLSHPNKECDIRFKIKKATYTKLRHHLINFAIEKGILAIGKPLPVVGAWTEGKVLLRLTETNLITVRQSSDPSSKETTNRDPLNNFEFIDLLSSTINFKTPSHSLGV